MDTKPITWHYGVVAHYWAEFNVSGPEIAYFRKFIQRFGEPALDAACGTGRLLIPYLHAGLEVDGCDISPDMLAFCRERAEREGLAPNLYAQALHDLSLPRRYNTIVFCGALGLGGVRQQDVIGLRRLYEHLEPGGALVLDTEVPYASNREWSYWLRQNRRRLPEDWGPPGERRRGSDGIDYALRSRIVEVDPLAQRVTLEMQAQMWRNDQLLANETHVLNMILYFKNEILLMLARAGFADVHVLGDHNDVEPTPDDDFLVFVATK
jgi:SAM-dependent methyltransferase